MSVPRVVMSLGGILLGRHPHPGELDPILEPGHVQTEADGRAPAFPFASVRLTFS
jgi:hypothetical protein